MSATAALRPPAALAQPEAGKRVVPLSESLTPGKRWLIVATVMIATLLEFLDTSIVNVAFPSIQGNLGATIDQIGWVSTAYIIANVVILPLTGWLSDFFGRKRYLTYSIILFTAASLGCGLSPDLTTLVLMRALQGAGGAAFLATSQATLIEIFPINKRGQAQAIFGLGIAVAPTLGPTLGGWITDVASWHWIFLINVPIGIVATFMTWGIVPDSPEAAKKRPADLVGIGLLAIGLGCFQTVLERGEREDWLDSGTIVALGLLAVAGLASFAWWVLRRENKHPAVDLRVLKNPNLAAGSVFGFVFGFAFYGLLFLLPQFFQVVQSHTAEQAGLLLLPGGLATAVTFVFVGRMSGKIDPRHMIAVGLLLLIYATWLFADRLNLHIPDEAYTWPLILRGVAIGLCVVPLSLISLGTLKPQEVGQGAGIYNLFRQVGGSVGIAIVATLVTRSTARAQSVLGENIHVGNLATDERLRLLRGAFQSRGYDAITAEQAALKAIGRSVYQQASVNAYLNVFWVVLGFCVIPVFLLGIFKKPGRGAAKAAAEAH